MKCPLRSPCRSRGSTGYERPEPSSTCGGLVQCLRGRSIESSVGSVDWMVRFSRSALDCSNRPTVGHPAREPSAMSDILRASPGEGSAVRTSLSAMSDGDEPPRILVVGATGYLGQRLVPRLLASGYRVRALVRSVDRARAALPPFCELYPGDVLAAETLRRRCAGSRRWSTSCTP